MTILKAEWVHYTTSSTSVWNFPESGVKKTPQLSKWKIKSMKVLDEKAKDISYVV